MEVVNIGPIHRFKFEVSVGVNEIVGGNEKGKSNLTNALASQLGADIPVRVTDGEIEGLLKRDGTVIAQFKRAKGKQPYVSLAGVSPIALVVDPGIKGADAAEETRLRNLVSMTGLKTTEETVRLFLTPEPRGRDDQPSVDDAALEYVDEFYGVHNLTKLDPVAAADVLVKGANGLIHKLRRKAEQEKNEAAARYNPPAQEIKSPLTVAEAQRAYDVAVGDHRQLQGEASQRAQLERQRAEIETTLGDRPDVFEADALVEEAEKGHALIAKEVIELEKQLSAARVREIAAKSTLDQRRKDAAETRRSAESWDRRQAILETPITGATIDDVTAAAEEIEVARQALQRARDAEEYQRQLAISEKARKERDDAMKREAEVKRLAESIPSRLGELFDQAGIPNARVTDGVLELKNGKGKWEPFERRSKGAQWRWALPIYLEHNPDGQIVLVKEAWNELDVESKQEIAQIFVDMNVIGYVEVTTRRDDPLAVRPFAAN